MSSTEDAAPYINVTPLIDVLLVLLIIFMVVSPLKPARFEAKVPAEPEDDQQTPVTPNPLTLVVNIASDGQVTLNKQPMGDLQSNTVGDVLRAQFREREAGGTAINPVTQEIEKTVFIKAPRSVKYRDVVRIFDDVKGAGASPVGLQIDDLQ